MRRRKMVVKVNVDGEPCFALVDRTFLRIDARLLTFSFRKESHIAPKVFHSHTAAGLSCAARLLLLSEFRCYELIPLVHEFLEALPRLEDGFRKQVEFLVWSG